MKTRILLMALYSPRYPAIGETHGLSTIAGSIREAMPSDLELMVVDMVALTGERERQALQMLEAFRPDVVGLSLTYGSFDVLQRMYPHIRQALGMTHPLIFGGVLATYIPEVLLKEIDSAALVVCGEGEEAMSELLRVLAKGEGLESVPNLVRNVDGRITHNARQLVDLSSLAQPYRDHVDQLARSGAQIFVEASRGCSWAACSFCLRGLTDIAGKATEYRRFPLNRLKNDFEILYNAGIRSVTFADEDFLGGLSNGLTNFVDGLTELMTSFPGLTFDASLTVRSVYDHRWTESQLSARRTQFSRLKSAGMRKAFLGIESGSPEQLKRYRKGHSAEEALNACHEILRSGIRLELGFIMFDPLCSLQDILKNVEFLLKGDLVGYVSFFCNEMRLQVGSRYKEMLEQKEGEVSKVLFDRTLDNNTLTYNTSYLDHRVAGLVNVARHWNDDFRKLHYPLKNLSRYGDGGSLGTMRDSVRALVISMRQRFLAIFRSATEDCEISGAVTMRSHELFQHAMRDWASDVLAIFHGGDGSYMPSEITRELLMNAKRLAA